VGISRALERRCRDHASNSNKNRLQTLYLPPLTLAQARSVEEALISHFGPTVEQLDRKFRPPTMPSARLNGQLVNKRKEIRRTVATYCQSIMTGQIILATTGYGTYAHAYYNRDMECPGTGIVG
jgi:hypothetical protein